MPRSTTPAAETETTSPQIFSFGSVRYRTADHDLVALVQDRLAGERVRLLAAERDRDFRRVERDAVLFEVALGHRFPECWNTEGRDVPRLTAIHRGLRGGADGRGRSLIGLADGEVEDLSTLRTQDVRARGGRDGRRNSDRFDAFRQTQRLHRIHCPPPFENAFSARFSSARVSTARATFSDTSP